VEWLGLRSGRSNPCARPRPTNSWYNNAHPTRQIGRQCFTARVTCWACRQRYCPPSLSRSFRSEHRTRRLRAEAAPQRIQFGAKTRWAAPSNSLEQVSCNLRSNQVVYLLFSYITFWFCHGLQRFRRSTVRINSNFEPPLAAFGPSPLHGPEPLR
jgi:hypothetical protein